MKFKNASVIGLGYIGLPTAAALATQKISVLGIDVNEAAVATINQGKIHIVEPELDVAVHAAVTRGYLRASLIPEPADAFLIAVPTPFKDDHEPDLTYIQEAAKSIAPVLKKGDLVILESTSPVGTTEKLSIWLEAERPDLTFPHSSGESSDIRVAHCPERVLPGQVMYELVHNDRVIGGITPKCTEAAKNLYQTFVRGECVETDAKTAEMCKLTENAARDVSIAFANELSVVCDATGIDVWELIQLANRHPRINILQPGPGVGGHCIAVDPWFIISQSRDKTPLMQAARAINDNKPNWVIEKVQASVENILANNPNKTPETITIACFGLAFKADIDDLRESPALRIAQTLAETHHGTVLGIEPNISELPDNLASSKLKLESTEQALLTADVYLLLVDHREFRRFNPSSAGKVVVDTRGIWIP
ncbi:MAG: UDP-N-acetyl-D-mannosaminuronic acid dehydrogenase [Candidatus Azotimanducaceae bacterium]|jgi:UDP-N-acetyl-D-mannosaminuronic acid dehydrogenase